MRVRSRRSPHFEMPSKWRARQSLTASNGVSRILWNSPAKRCRRVADEGCKLANVALDVSARMSARMAVRRLVEASDAETSDAEAYPDDCGCEGASPPGRTVHALRDQG